MRSNEVDSFLALFDPKGVKIAEDDDSGGKKDALIKVKLPISGIYTIYANSYVLGEIGRFSLTARLTTNQNDSILPNSGIILQRKGKLNANSEILTKDGTPFDLVEFRAEAGQMIKISLNSQVFQPYLVLIDPNRRIVGIINNALRLKTRRYRDNRSFHPQRHSTSSQSQQDTHTPNHYALP